MSYGKSGAPSWLVALQEELGKALRTPLDRSTGTLRPQPEQYRGVLCQELLPGVRGTRAGLEIYNRQYWFRLFGVMQSEFPLVARLVGFWRFNELAEAFLGKHPPSGHDIASAADGFADFLAQSTGETGLPREALVQAVWLDESWRRLWRAPEEVPFRPAASELASLAEQQLLPARGWVIFEESWPLVELRRRLLAGSLPGEHPVPLPPALDTPRSWALFSLGTRTGQLLLDPHQAYLLWLLRSHPIAKALGMLEVSCSPKEQAALPGLVQGWIARSVDLGFWTGLSGRSVVVDEVGPGEADGKDRFPWSAPVADAATMVVDDPMDDG
ncbi:MAG: putative DNA-binding domain-containing protein [Myxococcales bacterium]|nr:DNA-binding domain-containing protein [Polyangiaceae bacterium]MDW8248615.1 putative DNA-binding domain-containing protein [Myxococcales bacterium]